MRKTMPLLNLYKIIPVAVITIAAFITTGCLKNYSPPTATQPHAVLKLRRAYASTSGTHLRERFIIQKKYNLFSQTVTSREAKNPLIDGILIHPGPAEINAASSFFHYEQQMVNESYQVQEPYMSTESYNCGSSGQYRTCMRTVTKYRSVTKYRNVMKTVEVIDLSCNATIQFQPTNGHTYLLEMTFQGERACSLNCFKQTPNPDGTFSNTTCPALQK